MRSVVLASEDELSEAVGRRLLLEVDGDLAIDPVRRNGVGYLKSKMTSFCEVRRRRRVLILADLDRNPCPSQLIADWASGRHLPERLALRVAVREVEAWLLADHEGTGELLGRAGGLPAKPEDLQDPKRRLLELAKAAPRKVRNDLVATRGSLASQGLGYNARLCRFVENTWSPQRAEARAPSLARARRAIRRLVERE